jgi:DNA-binding NtrC family response regulator
MSHMRVGLASSWTAWTSGSLRQERRRPSSSPAMLVQKVVLPMRCWGEAWAMTCSSALTRLAVLAAAPGPLMVTVEPGAGKAAVARGLYAEAPAFDAAEATADDARRWCRELDVDVDLGDGARCCCGTWRSSTPRWPPRCTPYSSAATRSASSPPKPPAARPPAPAWNEALRTHGGNKLRAAQALGIARATVYRKLRSYGI